MMQKIYIGKLPISKIYIGENLLQQYVEGSLDESEEEVNINEVPYISNYYIEPIVDLNEEVIIEYYITDYYQKEYREGNYSQRFTLEYGVDGEFKQISNLKAGDHSINLGHLKEGIRLISLQVIDDSKRKSHRIYQEVKVINKEQYQMEIQQHTYEVTEKDLIDYSISKENVNPTQTTSGLNQLITWSIKKGYKKIVLPLGTYAIDENSGIVLKDLKDFILDLNGSTLKLNPNALDKVMMVSMIDCQDCHVINGIIQGDVNEHDYDNAPNSSEWVNAVTIVGGAYNSFEDLTIKDITGYGTNTMFGTEQLVQRSASFNFQPGDIIDGIFSSSIVRYSSDYVSLSEFRKDNGAEIYDFRRKGYVQVGAYLGYQGNVTDNWVFKATFYDAEKRYIDYVEAYAYRRIYLPQNAEYIRITLFSEAVPNANIRLFCLDSPINCSFKNIYHQNIRCVGMALCAFSNLLVKGCTFDYCGYALASCAIDAEDGWDLMQDLTFKENTFMNNPNNGFLACAGHNFIIEDNQNIRMYFWERTRSYIARRNTITDGADYRYQDLKRTGYVRIYENTNYTRIIPTIVSKDGLLVMRNETYHHNMPNTRNGYYNQGGMIKLIDSIVEYDQGKGITGFSQNMQFMSCTFNNMMTYLSSNASFIDCQFNNCNDMRFHSDFKKTFTSCIFKNCLIRSQGALDSVFQNCTFEDMQFNLNAYDNKEHQVLIKDCKIIINTREFMTIQTNTPILLKGCDIINHDTTKKIINCAKNGKEDVEVTLENNTLTQESGFIITGVTITTGKYTFTLSKNKIIGKATMIDTKYVNHSNISIIEYK